ncbi:MAG: hypothetical protein RLZZ86_3424 [Cyanobacteriota bacterium]|jgi:hypothetical protein
MKKIMQVYKLKGKIDQSGNLLITETVNLSPRDVEVIVWPATDTFNHTTSPTSEPAPETPKRKSRIKRNGYFIDRYWQL